MASLPRRTLARPLRAQWSSGVTAATEDGDEESHSSDRGPRATNREELSAVQLARKQPDRTAGREATTWIASLRFHSRSVSLAGLFFASNILSFLIILY